MDLTENLFLTSLRKHVPSLRPQVHQIPLATQAPPLSGQQVGWRQNKHLYYCFWDLIHWATHQNPRSVAENLQRSPFPLCISPQWIPKTSPVIFLSTHPSIIAFLTRRWNTLVNQAEKHSSHSHHTFQKSRKVTETKEKENKHAPKNLNCRNHLLGE